MGLNERSRVKKLHNDTFPGRVKDKASMKMTFEGGVLEMHSAYALRTEGMFSDNPIRELLLTNL